MKVVVYLLFFFLILISFSCQEQEDSIRITEDIELKKISSIENAVQGKSILKILKNNDRLVILSGEPDPDQPPHLCSIRFIYSVTIKAQSDICQLSPFHSIVNIAFYEDDLMIMNEGKLLLFNENYELKELDQMDRLIVSGLELDHENNIWISSYEQGLFCRKNNKWINYNKDNSVLPDNYITEMTCDESDIIWVSLGANNGLAKFGNNQWTLFSAVETIGENENIYKLTSDGTGNIWAAFLSGSNIIKYDGTEWKTIVPEYINKTEATFVKEIKSDKDGKVYFLYNDNYLYQFDGIQWKEYFINLSQSQQIITFEIVDQHIVMLGTNDGLLYFDLDKI